jgi:ribosomal-protein-alanine N-acetyltransferase
LQSILIHGTIKAQRIDWEAIYMRIKSNLVGTNIYIKNYELADKLFCTNMWFNKVNGKYLSDPTEEFVDDNYCQAVDDMYNSPNGYYFIITRICDNSRIGSFCAFPDETEQIIDIGYCIHQLYWRQGYATECLKMIIEWAQTQNFTTITAEVAKDNIASCKLLEKFNFKIKKESSYKKYHMNIEFKSYIFEYHITKPH